jgi:hypothetical protein
MVMLLVILKVMMHDDAHCFLAYPVWQSAIND